MQTRLRCCQLGFDAAAGAAFLSVFAYLSVFGVFGVRGGFVGNGDDKPDMIGGSVDVVEDAPGGVVSVGVWNRRRAGDVGSVDVSAAVRQQMLSRKVDLVAALAVVEGGVPPDLERQGLGRGAAVALVARGRADLVAERVQPPRDWNRPVEDELAGNRIWNRVEHRVGYVPWFTVSFWWL